MAVRASLVFLVFLSAAFIADRTLGLSPACCGPLDFGRYYRDLDILLEWEQVKRDQLRAIDDDLSLAKKYVDKELATFKDWISALKDAGYGGEPGPKGAPGDKGEDGDKGARGNRGKCLDASARPEQTIAEVTDVEEDNTEVVVPALRPYAEEEPTLEVAPETEQVAIQLAPRLELDTTATTEEDDSATSELDPEQDKSTLATSATEQQSSTMAEKEDDTEVEAEEDRSSVIRSGAVDEQSIVATEEDETEETTEDNISNTLSPSTEQNTSTADVEKDETEEQAEEDSSDTIAPATTAEQNDTATVEEEDETEEQAEEDESATATQPSQQSAAVTTTIEPSTPQNIILAVAVDREPEKIDFTEGSGVEAAFDDYQMKEE